MGDSKKFNLFCCCGERDPRAFLKGSCVVLIVLSVFFMIETIATILALGDFSAAAGGTYIFFSFDLTILIYSSVCLCQLKNEDWKDFISFGTTVLVLSIIRLVILILSFAITLVWVGILNVFVGDHEDGQKLVGSILAIVIVLYAISIILVSWCISLASNIKTASKKLRKKEKKEKKERKKAEKGEAMGGTYNTHYNQPQQPAYNYQNQPAPANNPYSNNNQAPQYPPQQQPPANYYNPNAPPQPGFNQGQGNYPPQQQQPFPVQPQVGVHAQVGANTGPIQNQGFVNVQAQPLQKKDGNEGL